LVAATPAAAFASMTAFDAAKAPEEKAATRAVAANKLVLRMVRRDSALVRVPLVIAYSFRFKTTTGPA
jgi:hypothetical protein